MAKQVPSKTPVSVDSKSKVSIKRPAAAAMEDDYEIVDKKSKPNDKKLSTDGISSSSSSSLRSKGSKDPTLQKELYEQLCLVSGVGPKAFAAKLTGSGAHRVHKHAINSTAGPIPVLLGASPWEFPLNTIISGSGSNQRIGSQIRVRHFEWRGQITWGTVTPVPVNIADFFDEPVRLVVCWDAMSPIANQVYGAAANPPNDANSLTVCLGSNLLNTYAPYNYMTKGVRYTVLHEQLVRYPLWNIGVDPTSGNLTLYKDCPFHISLDLDRLTTYNNDGSAQVLANNLILFVIGNNANANVGAALAGITDVTFTDEGTD